MAGGMLALSLLIFQRVPVLAESQGDLDQRAGDQAARSRQKVSRTTVNDICRTLAQAAADNNLPVDFFTRLIWQESRFDAGAVSSKGAQGIAQFMPGTASMRGLSDPFEPLLALRESA